MANRFLNNIKINDSYTLPTADGTADQVITTDGSGQLSFVDQSTLAVDSAEVVEIPVKNLQGSGLTKGDPVYISGSVGASGRLEVQLADAGNTAKMPAVGLLKQDLAINGEGYVVVTGKLRNLVTSPIDGVTPSEGDVVYVKSGGSTGAALTTTKPTGSSNLIQNMGKVGRVSTASDGTFVVSSILRSNDVPNLTTGKIWVGDGNTTESTVVHLDEANNEMGINTNNPAAVLHVTRSTGSVPLFQVDDVGDKYFQVLPDSNTTFLIGDLDALGGNGYIKGTFSSIQFHSESGELVRIKDNGNVGIGTTNPQKNLVVSDSSVPTIRIDNTKNGTWTAGEDFGGLEWYGNDASGEGAGVKGYIKLDSDNIYGAGFDMRFGTTDGTNGITERMVITKAGRVGIGTASPGTSLHIDTNSTNNIPLTVESGTTSSYVHFMDTGTTANYKVRVGSINDDLALWAGGSERARVKSTGNVGIGTTNPGRKLTLEGGGFSMFADGGTSADAFSVTTHNYAFTDENEDEVYSYNGTDGHKFSTGGNDRLNIIQSGNVGIGTTSPGAKVHSSDNGSVPSIDAGTMFLASNTSATGDYSSMSIMSGTAGIASLFFGDTDAEKRGSVRYLNSTDEMRFRTANTDRVTIKSGGNVGIGTTSVNSRLEVSSTGANGILISQDTGTTSNSGRLFFQTDTSSEGVALMNSNGTFQIRTGASAGSTSGTERVSVLNNGNVGIGTTSASEKLEVEGSVNNDDVAIRIENTYDDNLSTSRPAAALTFATASNNGYLRVYGAPADTAANHQIDLGATATNSYLTFSPNNSEKMRIASNGFVGINTTNPGYHLDVDGEARIGSTDRQSTRLLIQAENTAGAPAATTEIRMLGYESRAQGIFFQDSGNSGEEWFAGLNYSGSWDKYSIGYDASGGQGEYLDNAILTVKGSVARVGVKNHDPQADMDVNGTIRATGGTFTSGTSGADSQSSAGIVLRRGRRILSGIPNGANEDFYLRNLLEHTSSNSIIIGQGGTSLIADIALKPGTSGNITFFGSGSEDMRVDSSGDLQIGTSYNPGGYKVNVNGDIGATSGSQLHMFQNGGTGSTNAVIRVTNLDTSNYGQSTPNIYSDSGNYYGNRHCEFATNGTVRGYIGHNGSTSVTYSTTNSDERLKKNIEAWDEDTLNKFRNIQPKKFNFVDQEDTDPKDKGYIAQDMVDSFPEAYPHDYSISQTEGMYSFNPSGMVVYLMKAVKDLIAENDNLKARVEALENA